MKLLRSKRRGKSIKLNAMLSMVDSFLTMGFSLITYPYATRVLQVENLGKVNYASSIVSYFVLFAMLGFATYSIREGSALRNDNIKLQQFASEIFSLNLFTVASSCVIYIVSIFVIPKFADYRLLLLINGISIFASWIGVKWINVVFEDYLIITIRSIILHILMIGLMFLLVKKESDYYVYAGINVVSSLVVNIANHIYIRRYVKPRVVTKTNYRIHIKPVLLFFSNQIAVSIYLNSDTTMLGWMQGDRPVGLYSVSVKIYSAIKSLIAALYSVAIPRMSRLATDNNEVEFKETLNKIINSIVFVSIPSTFGLMCISEEVVTLISGESFIEAASSLRILAGAFFFAILGGMLAYCVSVPLKREKVVLKATVISAIENIVLNLLLIPLLSFNGAAITTLLAEATVFGVLFINLRDKFCLFDFSGIGKNLFKCLIGALVFFPMKAVVNDIKIDYNLKMGLYIVICIVAYGTIEIILKNNYLKAIVSITRKKN